MRPFKSQCTDTRGQAMVEFALVLPILLLLVLGIISYGLYINANVTLQQAARIGARAASVGDTVGCPGDSAQQEMSSGQPTTIYGVVDDEVNQGMGLNVGSGSSAQSVLTPPPTLQTTDPQNQSSTNSLVTVSVTLPYHPLVPFPGLLPSSMTLTQSYTMMIEQPQPSDAITPTGNTDEYTLVQPGGCP